MQENKSGCFFEQSVGSFNSTIPRTQFFLLLNVVTSASDLPMRTTKFCFVVFGVTSMLSVINKIRYGATAFVDHGRRTTHKCYNLSYTVKMLTTRDGLAVIDAKERHWSKIAIFAPVTGPRRNIAMTFGREKLEWRGCATVRKMKIMFIRFDRTD